jgi:fibronectin type III domain protein
MTTSLLKAALRPRICFVLVLALAPVPWSGAVAQASQQGVNCNDPIKPDQAPGNRKFVVTLDKETIWQPRNGEVRFTISGGPLTASGGSDAQVIACFRWRNAQSKDQKDLVLSGDWKQSDPPKLIKKDGNEATFAVTVPRLPPALLWFDRLSKNAAGEYTGLFYVIPISDLRVMAASTERLDVVLPVGITSVLLSSLIAIGSILIAAFVLWFIGKSWGIPGRNPVLKIISTRSGYASLSQLQIILWTFVVGGSAAYVMSLSGNLIDIKSGTLILLGITGVATLGSKLQSQQQGQQQTQQSAPAPVPPARPAKVAEPTLNGEAGSTEVEFSWMAPTGGGQPTTYMVRYRKATSPPGAWIGASNNITIPRIRIVGLAPDTPYEFQVAGVNAAGAGDLSDSLSVTTGPADRVPAGVPVTGLTATTSNIDPRVTLTWTPLPQASPPAPMPLYVIRYRPHDSADPWQLAGSTFDRSFAWAGLIPNTLYDFEVRPDQGSPAIVTAKSGPHIPGWADLVLDPDKGEIDVTRVQMLFFTLIVAVFVTLRVVTSGQIPDIPESFLLLMGISNGVYLTAKFVPSR